MSRKLSQDEIKVLTSIQKAIGEKIPTAIYARKSKEDKSQEAIDTQINVCKNFIEQNKQYLKLKKTYHEDNVSGMNVEGRSEFLKLADAVEEGFIKAVVVSKWDRFSRNTTDLKSYREKFSKQGALVITLEDSGEMSAVANLQFEIMASINQYYVHKNSEDTKAVLINKTSKGQSGGGIANYGYMYDEDKRLIIRAEEAVIVAEIYDRFEMGYSYQEIIDDLKRRNIKTRKGLDFTRSTLHDILTNVKYYGVYRYNRQDKKQSTLSKRHFDEVFVENGIKEPIITKAQFMEVSAIIEHRKGIKKASDYLLTGVMQCTYCHSKMIGSSQYIGKDKPRKRYYICPNSQAKKGKTCDNKGIDAKLIETQAKQITLDTINVYITEKKMNLDAFKDAIKAKERLKASINKSVDNINRAIEEAVNRLLEPDIKAHLKQAIEKSIEKKQAELADLNAKVKVADDTLNQYKMLSGQKEIGKLKENQIFKSAIITKKLLKMVINYIEVSNDDVSLNILEK